MPLSSSLDIDSAGNVTKLERNLEITQERGYFRGSFLAMGSPCEVLVKSVDQPLVSSILDQVAAEAWRIEDKFSRYLAGNIVDRINTTAGQTVEIDDETARLLDFAAMLTALSDGAFDITSGVLREVWRFDGSDRIPDSESIARIVGRVGWHKASWETPHLTLQKGMQIDFGGIGKEYAVDRAAAKVSAYPEIPCLVNFGGDIFASGTPEKSQGWQVGIDSINSVRAKANKNIRLKNGGLATSGDARRFLLKDGVRYCHILNPKTGWPITDAPRSITVAADTCTQAGMIATLAILKGPSAEAFLAEQGVKFWCYR